MVPMILFVKDGRLNERRNSTYSVLELEHKHF